MIPASLDAQLEPLTQALVQLTNDPSGATEVRVTAGEVDAIFDGDPSFLTILLTGPPAGADGLWDAQLLILTAIGYEPSEEFDATGDLALELDLDEGDSWDEQSLRELSAQTLGILYYVYEWRDAENYHLEVD